MNIAITRGRLSYPESQVLKLDRTEWMKLGQIFQQVAINYEILEIHPERQEILLKILDPTLFNPENIRTILQRLQEQTQCSFVALVNIASQSILITIRG
ncbi:MAG: hypothetical protein ACFFBD_06810 [Candidatus Hodarchaeota archaeon]